MKKTLVISAGIILLLAFLFATLSATSERAEETQQRVELNADVLVRAHAPSVGPQDARVRIVEFLDPACETCRRFYPFVKDLMAQHAGRVDLVLRYAPFHAHSDQVVALLLAADRQGRHWETLEALLKTQDQWVEHHTVQPEAVWPHLEGLGLDMERLRRDMADPAIGRLIAQDLADAELLGVTKTPEFFVNGQPMPSFGFQQLQGLVEAAVAQAYR